MPDPLRILLIGAGRMGAVHRRTLEHSNAAACVAIVDPDESVRANAVDDGLQAHRSLDEAFAIGGFDAAVVAAPSDLHLELVTALMDAKVPTLCEKPCGLRSTDTAIAARLAAEADVPLQIGYWRRFVPALRALRERITSGELGEIALVQAWQWDEEPPAADFRARSGGIARDMGVHEFDQIRWITGQEILVSGFHASEVNSDPPVPGDPESAVIVTQLSGGGLGLVSLGRRYKPGDSCWAEVIGTVDTARCEFMHGPEGDEVFKTALAAQLEAFVATVSGNPGDSATARDAVAALRAAEDAMAL